MSDQDKKVLQSIDTYKSAVLTKNVESMMSLYDPDVRVFDAWGTWPYEGAAAWRVAIEGWFASLGRETVRVTFEEVAISGRTGFASMSAIVNYAAISAQGQELRSMQNRISWVLDTSGSAPQVIHEHTSAPIGFEDAKAILIRQR